MLKSTSSRMAPDFTLPVLGGGQFSLNAMRGSCVLLNFWSAECPWSRRADVVLVYRYARWYERGLRIFGIASNFNEPENEIRLEAEKRHVEYPILLDAEQKIADLYDAQFTPHFILIDRHRMVRYIGALDDATAKNRRPKHLYLDRAISTVLADGVPDPAATPPYGCTLNRLRPSDGTQAVQVVDGNN